MNINLTIPARSNKVDPLLWIVAPMAALSVVCAGTIFLYLLRESAPVFFAEGSGFLTRSDWWVGESYGAGSMIFGSFMVTGIALIVILPFTKCCGSSLILGAPLHPIISKIGIE